MRRLLETISLIASPFPILIKTLGVFVSLAFLLNNNERKVASFFIILYASSAVLIFALPRTLMTKKLKANNKLSMVIGLIFVWICTVIWSCLCFFLLLGSTRRPFLWTSIETIITVVILIMAATMLPLDLIGIRKKDKAITLVGSYAALAVFIFFISLIKMGDEFLPFCAYIFVIIMGFVASYIEMNK